MGKIINFENGCSGKAYSDFIDYAFSKTDFFMLVYVDYYCEGYSPQKATIRKALKPFEVKVRTNPSWPGTPGRVDGLKKSSYEVVFYKNNEAAKSILKSVNNIYDWSPPDFPEDLAFFKNNQCWFLSIGHEEMASIIDPDKEDIRFLLDNGLTYYDFAHEEYEYEEPGLT